MYLSSVSKTGAKPGLHSGSRGLVVTVRALFEETPRYLRPGLCQLPTQESRGGTF